MEVPEIRDQNDAEMVVVYWSCHLTLITEDEKFQTTLPDFHWRITLAEEYMLRSSTEKKFYCETEMLSLPITDFFAF